MRLFIACEISNEAKKALLELQNKLKFARFTKVNSDAIHLTLKFLGEVNENKADEIKKRLFKVSFKPFKLKLSEIGVFPNENNKNSDKTGSDPRVIWVGLKPAEPVVELQQKIEKSLLGLFAKDEKFYLHLTLCRIKSIENKKELNRLLQHLSIRPIEFEITSFRLMKSELAPEGPKHEVLEEFRF